MLLSSVCYIRLIYSYLKGSVSELVILVSFCGEGRNWAALDVQFRSRTSKSIKMNPTLCAF